MKKIVAVVVGALAIASTVQAQQAVQWRVEDGGNGHWYRRFDTAWTWDEARVNCEQRGGYIATSTTAGEDAFLNAVDAGHDSHLGGYQTSSACEPGCDWRWITGEPWTYSNWNVGEPNNSGEEDYLQLGGGPGWNDHTVWHRTTTICEWSTDCNGDGFVDYGQILAGDLPDSNDNGVPDCCEQGGCDPDGDGLLNPLDNCPTVANPDQADCDHNGVGDACQAGNADCNTNGIPDYCDISSGTSNDADHNGVPDSCQPDCNLNQLPDAWEIATGAVTDLNADGIPDTCQGAVMVSLASDNLGAPSGVDVREWSFTGLQYAETGVELAIDVRGDLNGATEWIDVALNGGAARRFFGADGNDCPETPDHAVIQLARADFNALIGTTGTLTVRMACPATVDPTECKGAGLTRFALRYVGIDPKTGDCNGNQRLDVAETHDGSTPDCNGNMVPDSCDIARGAASDCNADGIPDSCQIAANPALDCNHNGIIDSCDVAAGGTAVDCDADGRIDSCQVVTDPASDCNGNARPDACDIALGFSADRDGNHVPDECQTVHVPGDFATIQAAIDAAPTDAMRIVDVAAGTYAGPINFLGKPVVVHGAGAGQTTIAGSGGQQLSVVRMAGEPAIAALEGVRVTGGTTGTPLPNLPSALVGGGVFVNESAASIRDCVIENNAAGFGGGIYMLACSGTVSNTSIRNNSTTTDGGGFQANQSSVRLTDVTITGNGANSRGGGLHLVQGRPVLTRVSVTGNASSNLVGGISWFAAGAADAYLSMESCNVTGNSAGVAQGGVGITDTSSLPIAVAMQGTTVCGNLPRPNVTGRWSDLGGNTVCDCAGDLTADGRVDGADLGSLLSAWGPCASACNADIDRDGRVDGFDLGILLANWGPCGG